MTDKSDYKPWLEYPHIWRTESAWLSFIRGGIRRYLWSKNPVKLEFIKERRIRIDNPSAKSKKAHPTVWGFQCEFCLQTFAGNNCETDHKEGEHSLKKASDIQRFVEGIVFIRKEDLQLLCKPCHKAKTHGERKGISFDLARIEKEVIAMEKEKTVLTYLEERDIVPAKNAKQRRQQCIEEMMKCT